MALLCAFGKAKLLGELLVSAGLLSSTLASERPAGEQRSSQARPQNSFTTSVPRFPNAYSSCPQQMSPSFLAVLLPLKTTPRLKCPARTFSRGQPLGLKC